MIRFIFACLLWLPLAGFSAEPELLEPEQAFAFSAKALEGDRIEVSYRIADAYYMYRDRFRFELQGSGLTLGPAQFPPGKIKDDPSFGRVETYRGDLKIVVPVQRAAGASGDATLVATSQGCADAGVCYLPQKQSAKLSLISEAAAAEPEKPGFLSDLKKLGSRFGGGSSEPLPPDMAFPLSVRAKDGSTLVAEFRTAANHYLYRDKIGFKVVGGEGVAVDRVALPKGQMKKDPTFGDTEVLFKPFEALVGLTRAGREPAKVEVEASFQGCNEQLGICYPPIEKRFQILLPAVTAAAEAVSGPAAAAQAGAPQSSPAAASPAVATPAATPVPAGPSGSESDEVAGLLKAGNFWLVVVSFVGFGLLLAFTPCVLPMIPILSGIIAGQGQHMTRTRGFMLSAAYVLGMAITYAGAGVAAGLSGTMLSAALQNPWVLGGFALVFVALAMSMFGFYELQMPSFIQTRFTEASNRLHGGHFGAVFVMGVLSAVIVGPCVAAPLAGALLYIGQTGDVVLGASALFAMAIGMGLPLLLVGASAGALLPRAGAWMDAVKRFFGVLLLGVAIYLISPVIPAVLHMLLWAALLIVSAIYLHAIDPLPLGASGFRKFWKGVGVIALLLGVSLLVGALSGGRDVLQPLSGLRTAAGAVAATHAELRFERVRSVAELDARIAQAKGRPVMLDFYADWCISCKEMERFTFSDPRVQARLKDTVMLQADVTANSADDQALLKRFGLYGPPGILFFDREGREVSGVRVVGFQDSERFLATLGRVI